MSVDENKSRQSLGALSSNTINAQASPENATEHKKPLVRASRSLAPSSKTRTTAHVAKSTKQSKTKYNTRQICATSYAASKTQSFTDRLAELNKRLSEARDTIASQTTSENQMTNQLMALRNEKCQLEFDKANLEEKNSKIELKLSDNETRFKEIESKAAKAQETLRNEYERKMEALRLEFEESSSASTKQHDDMIASIKNDLQAKHDNDLTELKKAYKEKKEGMKAKLKEREQTLQTEFEAACNRNSEKYKSQVEELKSHNLRLQQEVSSVTQSRDEFKSKLESVTKELESTSSKLTIYQSEKDSRSVQFENQIQKLQSQLEQQAQQMLAMNQNAQSIEEERQVARQKLLKAEAARRKLHNQLQELKGNIRVFCRVRPLLKKGDEPVEMNFPDCDGESQQLQISLPTVGGIPTLEQKVSNSVHSFSFDKVFNPNASNRDIFLEVEQLVQSALDGYNICIFAYGQTGSGKTFTMSNPTDGIIPLAISQIFATAQELQETGWEFEFHGECLEIYNEKILDLLGHSDDLGHGGKYEIRHDPATHRTTVTGLTSVRIESPKHATEVLRQANRNRSVAATMANHHSSRSHSVFILRLNGRNKTTGKVHTGVLNLIDLAGSERLNQSQAVGERLKETQAINKSLSSLGDVIVALGSGGSGNGGHIPYRNSKLTYLLQYSLSGNSKTLMMVNVSPLQAHANETINSLRFATKVNNTHIGTAKRLA